jgi:protein-S-isoprenylcysteine O-methyltransferase Ste14
VSRVRLPDLGPRGEGWVAGQLALYALAAWTGLRGPPWPARLRGPRRAAALLLGGLGAALLLAGSAELRGALTPNPRPRDGAGLRDHGAFRIVRHPIYSGVVVGALGWTLWLSPAALVPAFATGLWLDLKSRREEEWLAESYPEYAAYRTRVPHRFLPRLW